LRVAGTTSWPWQGEQQLCTETVKFVGFDRVAAYETAELACVVEVERFQAKVGGSEESVSVGLRVTNVFRRENGDWKLVHRHADPITTPQPPESVVRAGGV
jgi:ketosteroid isomerase-like protein